MGFVCVMRGFWFLLQISLSIISTCFSCYQSDGITKPCPIYWTIIMCLRKLTNKLVHIKLPCSQYVTKISSDEETSSKWMYFELELKIISHDIMSNRIQLKRLATLETHSSSSFNGSPQVLAISECFNRSIIVGPFVRFAQLSSLPTSLLLIFDLLVTCLIVTWSSNLLIKTVIL